MARHPSLVPRSHRFELPQASSTASSNPRSGLGPAPCHPGTPSTWNRQRSWTGRAALTTTTTTTDRLHMTTAGSRRRGCRQMGLTATTHHPPTGTSTRTMRGAIVACTGLDRLPNPPPKLRHAPDQHRRRRRNDPAPWRRRGIWENRGRRRQLDICFDGRKKRSPPSKLPLAVWSFWSENVEGANAGAR